MTVNLPKMAGSISQQVISSLRGSEKRGEHETGDTKFESYCSRPADRRALYKGYYVDRHIPAVTV